jgi:F-type H+-transporting ATPase subunit alpha
MKLSGKLIAASKLSKEEIDDICQKFQKMLGEEIDFVIDIDKSIIGGYKIVVGDKMYDLSVESYLNRIKKSAQSKSDSQFDEYLESLDMEGEVKNIEAQKQLLDEFKRQVNSFNEKFDISHIGVVESSGDGVVYVQGLSNCKYGELLQFENGVYGIVMNLEIDRIGAVLLNGQAAVNEGSIVHHTGEVVRVPVGEVLFGRVINPIGTPIDGKGKIGATSFRPIEAAAPPIMSRQSVYQPLQTGIMAIDSMIPIGRGQRELIIGDRKTGKSAIAIDTIINQKGKGVFCVYVAIAQKASSIAEIVDRLTSNGAMEYTTVVASMASDTAAMQYMAPYAGCAVAEDMMYDGKDVLVVYDDLSKHAIAYRTMSLLLRRPPGREAYPGDVFYLHSRLLERAAKLSEEMGGGSMTALPIIETMDSDISAYIPTNVISITDGQIYLESELFNAGQRPAVNVGLSVSRVGGEAQIKAMRKVAGRLRILLAQYRELAVFSQFASDLDRSTREALDNGIRLMQSLVQPQYTPYSVEDQVILLQMAINKTLLDIPVKNVRDFNEGYLNYVLATHGEIKESIKNTGDITDEEMETLNKAAVEYKTQFIAKITADLED